MSDVIRPPVPGDREPGMLTTFGVPPASVRIVPEGPSTMDAATIAARQREGGGAPSQRGAHRSPYARAYQWMMGFVRTSDRNGTSANGETH